MDMVNNEYAIGQERLKAEKVKHAKVVKENDALKSKTKSAIYVELRFRCRRCARLPRLRRKPKSEITNGWRIYPSGQGTVDTIRLRDGRTVRVSAVDGRSNPLGNISLQGRVR